MHYKIEMREPNDDFIICWQSAGRHLVRQIDTGTLKFFRAHLNPPILEHLSFILGNHIYFVCVVDEEGLVSSPTGPEQCLYAAEMAKGQPCLMPMKKTTNGWMPVYAGWGLIDIKSGSLVDPVANITEEKIEISDWELMDFAIQYIVADIEKNGGEIMSTNSNPEVNPSIFFVNEEEQVCFVQVFAGRHPKEPLIDTDLASNLKNNLTPVHAQIGYTACVTVASAYDAFDPDADEGFPLFRGDPYYVKFHGLQRIE